MPPAPPPTVTTTTTATRTLQDLPNEVITFHLEQFLAPPDIYRLGMVDFLNIH
jgi:hypothetical protein